MLGVGTKILVFSLLEIHRVFDLLRARLLLHLHLVKIIHPLRRILDLVQEPHLLQAVPLIRPIHHGQCALWFQDHPSLFGAAHLEGSVGSHGGVVHVADLGTDGLGVRCVTVLGDDLGWVLTLGDLSHCLLHRLVAHWRHPAFGSLVLLRVVDQFALGPLRRSDECVVPEEAVGALLCLFLVESCLSLLQFFELCLALLDEVLSIIILLLLELVLVLRSLGLCGRLLWLGRHLRLDRLLLRLCRLADGLANSGLLVRRQVSVIRLHLVEQVLILLRLHLLLVHLLKVLHVLLLLVWR